MSRWPKQTFSKEDIRMPRGTWKDAQHHWLLEKWISKLQWDITAHQSEWSSSKKSTNSKCWRGCGEKGTLLCCWWECKLVQGLWRTVWRFFKNLKIELTYDPAVPLLGIYAEENMLPKYISTPVFIAALFTIAKTWKKHKCPSTEWIKKTWYIHTMEYYSAIKKRNSAICGNMDGPRECHTK